MQRRYASPEDAEQAFYEAFERSDIDLMISVWAEDAPLSCVHPGAPRLIEHADIIESWRQIFAANLGLSFTRDNIQRITEEKLSVHMLHEEVKILGEVVNHMAVTNIFRFNGDSWYMVAHHASSEASIEDDDEDDDDEDDFSEAEIEDLIHGRNTLH